tara:strand:+ start:115 stop:453 length:339 start_codon:yes stop_codon:yes gene_type:complete
MTKIRDSHDLGGEAGSVIDTKKNHNLLWWEKRVDALMMLLSSQDQRIITVDELRHGIEELGSNAYEKLNYYDRWMHSITRSLLQKGIIQTDELNRKMAEIEMKSQSINSNEK